MPAEAHGNGECQRIAVLSRAGVVPEPLSLGLHTERFRLRNHPSRHRKERDDAALPTQEGNFSRIHR